MDNGSQRALSARAAARHAEMLASGPPRYGALLTLCAVLCTAGAAVAAPFTLAGAAGLAAIAVLLGWVRVEDRRCAWRYAPEEATPAQFLPLRGAAPARPLVIDLVDRPVPARRVPARPVPARPALPGVLSVHTPTLPRVVSVVPQPRVAGATRSMPLPTPRRAPSAERLARSNEPAS